MEIMSAKNKSLEKDIKNTNVSYNTDKSTTKPCSIALRIKNPVYATLNNYLTAMHSVSDYRFGSLSDILRYILLKIEQEGFQNEALEDEGAEYKHLSIKTTHEQQQFWRNLPAHNRRKILEKGIIAFIKGKL